MTEYVFAKDLQFNLKKPCADCPFLKSAPFHQGVASSLVEYHQSIEEHRFSHSCHKTDNRAECDGPHNYDGPPEHCVGAIIMLIKSRKDLQLPLLQAIDDGKLDIEAMTKKAKADKSVFTLKQMLRFYAGELRKQLKTNQGTERG